MTSRPPSISVVMPVYNGGHFLAETLDSLLKQTFKDFELIVIDDGSTDATPAIVRKARDPRIRYLANDKNRGISFSANRGIEEARGKYMARADADDIHLPDRLKIQWKFMESKPAVHVCGSYMGFVDGALKDATPPTDHDEIKAGLPFYTTLAQPTSFFRLNFLREKNIRYDISYVAAGDYDLWFRMTHNQGAVFANIPEVLVRYRLHAASISMQKGGLQAKLASDTRKRHFMEWGLAVTDDDMGTHNSICAFAPEQDKAAMLRIIDWLLVLRAQNERMPVYADVAWKKTLAFRLLGMVTANAHLGAWSCKLFLSWPDAHLMALSAEDVQVLMLNAATMQQRGL